MDRLRNNKSCIGPCINADHNRCTSKQRYSAPSLHPVDSFPCLGGCVEGKKNPPYFMYNPLSPRSYLQSDNKPPMGLKTKVDCWDFTSKEGFYRCCMTVFIFLLRYQHFFFSVSYLVFKRCLVDTCPTFAFLKVTKQRERLRLYLINFSFVCFHPDGWYRAVHQSEVCLHQQLFFVFF